jgi:hypothetical protein
MQYAYFDKVEIAKLISKLGMALATLEENEDVAITVHAADRFTGLGIEVHGQGFVVHGKKQVKVQVEVESTV